MVAVNGGGDSPEPDSLTAETLPEPTPTIVEVIEPEPEDDPIAERQVNLDDEKPDAPRLHVDGEPQNHKEWRAWFAERLQGSPISERAWQSLSASVYPLRLGQAGNKKTMPHMSQAYLDGTNLGEPFAAGEIRSMTARYRVKDATSWAATVTVDFVYEYPIAKQVGSDCPADDQGCARTHPRGTEYEVQIRLNKVIAANIGSAEEDDLGEWSASGFATAQRLWDF